MEVVVVVTGVVDVVVVDVVVVVDGIVVVVIVGSGVVVFTVVVVVEVLVVVTGVDVAVKRSKEVEIYEEINLLIIKKK